MRALTGGVTRPRSGRRSRRSLAFALSGLVHALVLGWFALRHDAQPPNAEAPTMQVQLVEAPRPPRQAPTPSDHPASAAPTRAAPAIAPRPAAAPAAASGAGQGGVDVFGPVFADGQWPRKRIVRPPPCDPIRDPERRSAGCQREEEIARGVTRAYDPANGRDEFANEARRNEAVRRYHELPGTAGYPGIACQILHRC